MVKRKPALSLLFLVVIASGCIGPGPADTKTEGKGSITVTRLDITPSQIYSGDEVRAWLEVRNTGKLTGSIDVGKQGKNVLSNSCPDIFEVSPDSFSAQSTTQSADSGTTFDLKPDERMILKWELQHTPSEFGTPMIGMKCDVEFAMPFNYSVKAFRQIQVKQNSDIEGSPGLESRSSSGPMLMSIRAIQGTTGEPNTFVTGEKDIDVAIDLHNTGNTEVTKGLIDIHEETLRVKASGPLKLSEGFVEDGDTVEWSTIDASYSEERCDVPQKNIRMIEGKSASIRCEIPIEEVSSPSELAEINAEVDYTYVKDGGTKTVRVENRE